ncbi:hypothetical protein ASA1KI_07000 [Opitutales bacterium ASA1]|uniref:hypothetical protein n=1 Tax=Congregicoccus parvus TaxID=3081749 RepID=UPI002B2980E7|nr:hypothetical protein ASA1KI_07000 [Opitutales bacterium ASA1]
MNTCLRTSHVLFLTAVVPLATVRAQWPHRVDLDLLATTTDTFASSPHVVADGTGGVFAVWDDNRNSATSGRDIYAQHYDANGIAKWTPGGVAVCTAANRQNEARVVAAGGGSVYVVWSDERGSANNERVFAQLLNAEGEPQWTADGIRIGPNEFDQSDLVAIGDGAGALLVAWGEVSNNFRTFVQKVDATGTGLWGTGGFEFSSGVFEGASVFNLVPDGTGGVVAGWIRFGDNPRTIYARRILAAGSAAFDAVPFGVDLQALGNFIPMAPDGTGGAYLGWQVDNGVNDNLFIQRVDGTGALPWGTGSKQLVDAPGVQDNLHLVADASGGAFLVWDDPRTGVDDVYVQHVTSIGSFSLAANGIPIATPAAQRFSARAIPDDAGGAIVSYRQNQDGTFAQRIDHSGTRLWGSDGSHLTDNGSVNFPHLTGDGAQGAILGVLAFTEGNRPALKRVLASGELPTSRLVNISTRAFVGTGGAQAIPGFVIGGSGSKQVLVRAVGPTLGLHGVAEPLPDPFLTLFDKNDVAILSRDDWGAGPDVALIESTALTVGAFDLPAGSKDAAIVSTLAAERHTAGVTGVADGTGVALVEIYDADPLDAPTRLVNLSSRVFVGTGEQVAIPGFVVVGPATIQLLIRAVGPTLEENGVAGALADPILTLYDADDMAFASNDDWGSVGATQRNIVTAATLAVGAFELETTSKDSTLLVTLAPGKYTAGVVGADGGTGICLVELYVVP